MLHRGLRVGDGDAARGVEIVVGFYARGFRYRACQVRAVGAGRDEQQHAHGEGNNGCAVFFPAAGEIFFRQHARQTEQLVGKLA